MIKLLVLVFIAYIVPEITGHGSMVDPPARNAAWRFGFSTPQDWQDMELFCGGFVNMFEKQNGQCGVCGDPFQGPRKFECPDGEFCKKVIVRKYTSGQTIPVKINLVANHVGYFTFRICPVTDESKEVTWDCLKQHELTVVESGSTKWPLPQSVGGDVSMHVKLPAGLKCERCVMQWHWVSGNRWGKCDNGTEGMGCGPKQETFINCADVSIS